MRKAFFARAGLPLVKPRGAREYRGTIAGFDGIEMAYLSAAEITAQLAQGAVHLGVTGEDLVREMIPQADARVILLEGLGFGFANVVVAVPQAWIDVRSMADLDDVATAFRLRHNRKMRVATKYVNLTRAFFRRARHRRLPDRGKPRRDRRRARGRHRRDDRRHHHDRHDARRQRAEDGRRRHDAALAGQSRRLARGRLARAASSRPRA